jgi:ABC-type lipoprotein release transport system permease subunit
MNAVGFAWRSLVRQPARASLGVLGVAAVGALLFDMLLLSEGLVLSMRDMFDRVGFDLRVTATDALPGQGPQMNDGVNAARDIAGLPGVRSSIALRFANGFLERDGARRRAQVSVQGIAGTGTRPWSVMQGRDLQQPNELLVSARAADLLSLEPGSSVRFQANCIDDTEEALPPVAFAVVGIADFPFDTPYGATIATDVDSLARACGDAGTGQIDVIMVATSDDRAANDTIAALATRRPELRVLTNEELVGRVERGGFSYFRQISTVLTAVTVTFAVLLITVLLTVSVNQRLGEIAALRALGFSRRRVIADVLSESALIVGGGGLASLPLGGLLAIGLDMILKRIPGIPSDVHFFVYRHDAVAIHVALLAVTALIAALYPMQVVARLPIAATLRNEVVS